MGIFRKFCCGDNFTFDNSNADTNVIEKLINQLCVNYGVELFHVCCVFIFLEGVWWGLKLNFFSRL